MEENNSDSRHPDSHVPTVSEYVFLENLSIVGIFYVVLSVLGVFFNSSVLLVLFKSTRMRHTPKYWLVLMVSITLWFQAVVTNPQMVVIWFGATTRAACKMWVAAEAYNTYACVGIACWCSLLLSFDYLFCVASHRYRQIYRDSVMMCLLFFCIFSLIVTLAVLSFVFGSNKTPMDYIKCHFGFTNEIVVFVLLVYTVYLPLIGSVILNLLGVVFLHRGFEWNLNVSLNVQGYSSNKSFPPLDHSLLLIILILCYVPATVMHHLVLNGVVFSKENKALVHLSATTTVLRDNAGCMVPLVWYCFCDMRDALKQLSCCKRKASPSDSAFQESSEFRLYDCYPYCA
ncbi:hypothetical protein PoB_004007600 [Plakobranchus ocellatus]|uniref:G-protein coupled receptors family 1 profile domain-containing protein n=1 Tax=Plakobranchus ocellatus TaxID=259542 RepID=A0AAV4AQZ5_9GAST|nr:hypothetical protein PoB_004007600 [Plakobranchus ocellatus]